MTDESTPLSLPPPFSSVSSCHSPLVRLSPPLCVSLLQFNTFAPSLSSPPSHSCSLSFSLFVCIFYFIFLCSCLLLSVSSLNNLSLFCSLSFSPCSSRVHTHIRLHFASGRSLTAAPSATSGRTIQICIST